MKRKKITCRIAALWLAAVLAVGVLPGCGRQPTDGADGRLSIVATVFPQYDFARRIAGDRAEVVMLLKPGMEAHTYEPSPKDMIRIARCDLFLNVGGESESWLASVLTNAENPRRQVVSAMSCVSLREEETVAGMQQKGHHHDHDEDDHDGDDHDGDDHDGDGHDHEEEPEYDEHVWTSPMNAIAIVNRINSALCTLDPDNAAYYCANTERYVTELLALDQAFRDTVLTAKRREVVFGDRFPLLYFVREYGLDYHAAFPGCAAETEPSAATVAFLIDTVKREKIPVIFYIELSNHKVADAIAECTGARTALFHTCHNISADDFAAGESYLSLMQANVTRLKEALQ